MKFTLCEFCDKAEEVLAERFLVQSTKRNTLVLQITYFYELQNDMARLCPHHVQQNLEPTGPEVPLKFWLQHIRVHLFPLIFKGIFYVPLSQQVSIILYIYIYIFEKIKIYDLYECWHHSVSTEVNNCTFSGSNLRPVLPDFRSFLLDYKVFPLYFLFVFKLLDI